MDMCAFTDLCLDRFSMEEECKHIVNVGGWALKHMLVFIEDHVVLMCSLSTPAEPATRSCVPPVLWACANKRLRISEMRVGQNIHLI